MGKVVKAVAKIALVTVGAIYGGPIGASIGFAVGNALMPPKAPRVPLSQLDRLNASINPTAFRCAAFGDTAQNTDIRYGFPSGTDQRYVDYVVGVACHRVESIDEIWIENRKAWSAASGYEAWTIVDGVNRLTVTVRTEGTAGNAIAIGGSWNGTARLTGCAYVRLRIDRQGTKKTDSPFANGLPSRVTIKGKGWPLYDPRLDSTRGGSGAHRADNQATWGTTGGRNNPALQILNYLIGWRIGGKLSVGCGAPLDDLDFDAFIAAANACDEAIALAAGGTQPRYRGAGVCNEGEDRGQVLGTMLDACNGELRDNNGKIGLFIRTNDLASPVATFSERNILGTVRRSSGNTTETPTVVRGRYTDPSDTALYTLADVPEVLLPGSHPVERVLPVDLSWVQDAAQAQRIFKQILQRAQYADTLEADYDLTALKAEYGQVVEQDFAPLGWSGAKFRVARQVLNTNGRITMTLGVEHASIYAWDAEEAPAVTAAAATAFDPLNAGPILAAVEAAASAAAAQATNSANLYRVEMAGYSKSIGPSGAASHLYGDSLVVAQYRVDLDEVGVGVGERISASLLWSLSQAGSATFRVGLYDAADTIVRTVIGPSVTTPVTNLHSILPGVVRQAGERYVRLFIRVDQAGGTLAMSMGMINRGPICAPYVAPTRGATYGSTWDQVTGAGKPEDGATRNAYQGVHNSANIYLKGDIVILGDGTKSYIAKQNVPASTLITNTAYWGLLVEGGGGAAGEAGYSAILSNQSHVVATASDGSGGDYSDAGGQMSIYEGATNRTGSATFAKVGAGSWYSINSAGVYTISDPGTDDATCQFDATYGSVTLRLTYSISKSKGGAVAKAVKVTRTREVITYDGTGALVPSTQTTTFNAVLQNSSATVNWSATDLAGNAISPVTNLLSAATGASVTMTAANFETRRGATNGVIVTASISDGGTHSDVVTVMKVQDGAVGASAYSLVQSASNRYDLSVPGVIRRSSGGNTWNNSWRSAAPYQGAVFVSFRAPSISPSIVVGFDTSPTLHESTSSYSTLDYALQIQSDGTLVRMVNGGNTTIGGSGTAANGDTFALRYDGKIAEISHNGSVIDTYAAIADGQAFYVKGTINGGSGYIDEVAISAAGRAGDAGAAGRDAVVFRQDTTPSSPVTGDTWVTITAPRVWKRYNGSGWDQILGDLAGINIISDNAYLGNLVVENANIANLTVGTEKIVANGVTVPWYVEANTLIDFASATKTECLSMTITKQEGDSMLEVHSQQQFFGGDAIQGVASIEVRTSPGGTLVGQRSIQPYIDGNGQTYWPVAFEGYFSGIAAGDYTVKIFFTRNTGNTCATYGVRHMRVREFMR